MNRNPIRNLVSYFQRPLIDKQIGLPDWFPLLNWYAKLRPPYIILNAQNMTQMAKLDVASMAALATSFLQKIWLQGCAERKVQVKYRMPRLHLCGYITSLFLSMDQVDPSH